MPEGSGYSDLAAIIQLAAILAKMDNPADPMTIDVLDRAARLLGTVSPVAGSTWDVSDRAARLLGTVSPVAGSTWDISDRAARLLGVVYGSAASLQQATPADALANPANALAAAIFPHVFDATAGDWNRWLESPTQGIPYVEERPAATIGVLADVVAAAAATQLTAASTPCRAVVVRALRANTGNVRVGGAGVLVGSGAELSAGDSVSLAVSNVNLIYVFGNGTDKCSITYVN